MRLVRYNYPTHRSYSPLASIARNPWYGLNSEIDRLFSSAYGAASPGFGKSLLIDLYEDQNNAYVRADLPGVTRDAISIDLVENSLTIKATRKQGHGENAETVTFNRAITVPENIKGESVSAAYENGVLTVTLPKKEEAKPRKVSVQVS